MNKNPWRGLPPAQRKQLIKFCCALWNIKRRAKLNAAAAFPFQEVRDGFWEHMSTEKTFPTLAFSHVTNTLELTWDAGYIIITAQVHDTYVDLMALSIVAGVDVEEQVYCGPPSVNMFPLWERVKFFLQPDKKLLANLTDQLGGYELEEGDDE